MELAFHCIQELISGLSFRALRGVQSPQADVGFCTAHRRLHTPWLPSSLLPQSTCRWEHECGVCFALLDSQLAAVRAG